MRIYGSACLAALAVSFAASISEAATAASPADPWTLLYKKGNLSVYGDSSQPVHSFKTEGVIDANLFDLMAVLADIGHRTPWVQGLTETRIIDGDVEKKVIIYEQYWLPWPCQNRDSVVESDVNQDHKNLAVTIDYHEVPRAEVPARKGITRMPSVRGSMFFRYIDKTHSYARVIISLDVGGSLPRWVVNRFLRQVPFLTVAGLTERVKKTHGEYRDFVRRHVAIARQESAVPFETDDP